MNNNKNNNNKTQFSRFLSSYNTFPSPSSVYSNYFERIVLGAAQQTFHCSFIIATVFIFTIFTSCTAEAGSIVAEIGESVLLPCGPANITYDGLIMWRNKNNHAVAMFSTRRNVTMIRPGYSIKHNRDLFIPIVSQNHSGIYYCTINNLDPKNFTTILQVYAPPTIKPFNVTDLRMVENDALSIQCQVDSFPPAKITWIKKFDSKGNLNFKTNVSQTETNGILLIDPIKYEHGGQYVCEAKNHLGSATSEPISVRVEYKPKVEVKPYFNGNPGNTAILYCTFRSNPLAQITWLFNGRPIQDIVDTDKIIQNKNEENGNTLTSSLIIDRIKESDLNGIYTCQGTNPLGQVSYNLTIKSVPEIVKVTKAEEIIESDGSNSALIEFTTVSHSPLKAYLLQLFEGNVVKNLTIPAESTQKDAYTQSFKLKALASNTEYGVKIQAENEYGWSDLPNTTFEFLTNPIVEPYASKPEYAGKILNSAPHSIPHSLVSWLLIAILTYLCALFLAL